MYHEAESCDVLKREMPSLLELFAGTGSVGRVFGARGWDVLSLDVDRRSSAAVHTDIMEWDYTQFSPGHFDAIWASPPCTNYSVARTTGRLPRNLWYADALVQRVLDIVAYLKPKAWWMENPETGLLKTRAVVADLPYQVADYCMYGAPYRKRTALWGNVPADPKTCNKQCSAWTGSGHRSTAQRREGRGQLLAGLSDRFTLDQLHAIPWPLVEVIEQATTEFITQAAPPPAPPAVEDAPASI